MNELQIFNNPEFGNIRTVTIDGEPWFVGKYVAEALGYCNPSKAVFAHVDDEDKRFEMLPVSDSQNGNLVKTALINESGVYSLTFSSKLKKAKEFKRWITHEVIPTILKQGGYLSPEAAAKLTEGIQERVQAAWAETFQKLTEGVQNLTARMETMEALIDPFAPPRALPAPPPPEGEEEPAPPGRDYMRRWMRTASEKLDLMSSKLKTGNNTILHQIYGYIENHFNVVLEEERLATIESYGLDSCSTLIAVFYDEDFRGYFERTVDANLAPENRGW